MEAIEKAGYKDNCQVGMDVAASEFRTESKDEYDLGTWYPQAERNIGMLGKLVILGGLSALLH
eukprot:12411425-Karenia_brevis.AAC.1